MHDAQVGHADLDFQGCQGSVSAGKVLQELTGDVGGWWNKLPYNLPAAGQLFTVTHNLHHSQLHQSAPAFDPSLSHSRTMKHSYWVIQPNR